MLVLAAIELISDGLSCTVSDVRRSETEDEFQVLSDQRHSVPAELPPPCDIHVGAECKEQRRTNSHALLLPCVQGAGKAILDMQQCCNIRDSQKCRRRLSPVASAMRKLHHEMKACQRARSHGRADAIDWLACPRARSASAVLLQTLHTLVVHWYHGADYTSPQAVYFLQMCAPETRPTSDVTCLDNVTQYIDSQRKNNPCFMRARCEHGDLDLTAVPAAFFEALGKKTPVAGECTSPTPLPSPPPSRAPTVQPTSHPAPAAPTAAPTAATTAAPSASPSRSPTAGLVGDDEIKMTVPKLRSSKMAKHLPATLPPTSRADFLKAIDAKAVAQAIREARARHNADHDDHHEQSSAAAAHESLVIKGCRGRVRGKWGYVAC